MKLTVMLPAYTTLDTWDMSVNTAIMWRPYCDELIISEDGEYSDAMQDLCDIYILHAHMGVADSSNIGWKMALANGADFVAIMDTDVTPKEGNLQDLCVPGKVCVPQTIGWEDRVSVAPMLVVAKEVTAERGFYDSCHGLHAMKHFDADYQVRVRDLIEFHPEFKVDHLVSQTTGKYMTRCACGRCNDAY